MYTPGQPQCLHSGAWEPGNEANSLAGFLTLVGGIGMILYFRCVTQHICMPTLYEVRSTEFREIGHVQAAGKSLQFNVHLELHLLIAQC